MHITDTQLALGSKHALEAKKVSTIALERIRDPGPISESNPRSAHFDSQKFEEELNQLLAARLQENSPVEPQPCCHAREPDRLGIMLSLLFGQGKCGPFSPPDLTAGSKAVTTINQAPSQFSLPRARWQITRSEISSETEICQFSANGKVCLADGSERQFEVGFQFERSEQITQTSRRTLVDPLVLDLSAPLAALGDTRVEFDLDNDGQLEQMQMPTDGSALLFLDRNHNGRADNGSELFGPASGNGFNELASLDSDTNGWIDEADAAFADLKLWQADSQEQRIRNLAEAGVGALATASAETGFQIKEKGAQVGQMRSSGVWLGEAGGAGSLRQIDLATEPLTRQK